MTTKDFYFEDYNRTLFPLETTKFLINHYEDRLREYIKENILVDNNDAEVFLPQTRVYIPKYDYNLRRTVKLDPIAEFFIYDVIYKNRANFYYKINDHRQSFGYTFEGDKSISPNNAYQLFKAKITAMNNNHKYFLKFDISTYFNSLYHHDLCNWFNDIVNKEEDKRAFGKFLRQINAGRSIDCLPQGIYPCKVIGANFLEFIDKHSAIESEVLLRFMDDFYLFSNSEDTLRADYLLIQKLLGAKGLSVNPLKTLLSDKPNKTINESVDEVKISLLKIRRKLINVSGEDVEDQIIYEDLLSDEQVEYLLNLLKEKDKDIEEEDAELVLAVLRSHSSEILEYIPIFLHKFPNLIKNIYYFINNDMDKERLSNILIKFISKTKYISEYQLFWIVKIIEEYLMNIARCRKLLLNIYEHKNSSIIVKAKILEIPDDSFGLREIREEHLASGNASWLTWASAVGYRNESKQRRNYVLKYFSKTSAINGFIGTCVAEYEERKFQSQYMK